MSLFATPSTTSPPVSRAKIELMLIRAHQRAHSANAAWPAAAWGRSCCRHSPRRWRPYRLELCECRFRSVHAACFAAAGRSSSVAARDAVGDCAACKLTCTKVELCRAHAVNLAAAQGRQLMSPYDVGDCIIRKRYQGGACSAHAASPSAARGLQLMSPLAAPSTTSLPVCRAKVERMLIRAHQRAHSVRATCPAAAKGPQLVSPLAAPSATTPRGLT